MLNSTPCIEFELSAGSELVRQTIHRTFPTKIVGNIAVCRMQEAKFLSIVRRKWIAIFGE